jgi:hypothetical protein
VRAVTFSANVCSPVIYAVRAACCARCGRTFQGAGAGKQHPTLYYYCRSWSDLPSIRRTGYCQSPTVFSRLLDAHVWSSIMSLILAPDLVALGLREDAASEKRAGYAQQADYLTGLVRRKEQELTRWDEGYAAGYLTVEEWGAKHKAVLADISGAREGLRKIEAALIDKSDETRTNETQHLGFCLLKAENMGLAMCDVYLVSL